MASQMIKDEILYQNKKACRLVLKHKRQAISEQRRQEAASAAYQYSLELVKDAKWVLSYASFSTELDVWTINQELAQQHRLVLPKIKHNHLILLQVSDLRDLELNSWGILEPIEEKCMKIKPSELSIAFIPGLGFDTRNGHRLGYGKGYYDRLLEQVSSSIRSYGIGFREQAWKNLPFTKNDSSLTAHYLF